MPGSFSIPLRFNVVALSDWSQNAAKRVLLQPFSVEAPLSAVSLVVLVKSIRERKESPCDPCAPPPSTPGSSPWPEETLEEDESPERIAQWDNQAPPESPEDDPFEELLPSDPSDPASRN